MADQSKVNEDGTPKQNHRTNKQAKSQQRSERGGSIYQTTPPTIPDRSHRHHGTGVGVGCWITRF